MRTDNHQKLGIRKRFSAACVHAAFAIVKIAIVVVLFIGMVFILPADTSQALAVEKVQSANPAALPSASLKTIIVENYYPYTFVNDKGVPDGFSVDVARAVVETMDRTLEISVDTWAHATNSLADGTIDLLPMMAYSPERDRSFDFSAPHTIAYDALFLRKGTPGIRSLKDLADKTVIVMNKDVAHQYLMSSGMAAKMKLILVDSLPDALRTLAEGKGDAALMPKLVGLTIVKKLNLTNLDPSPVVVEAYNRPFSFAVRGGNQALLERLSQGLSIIKTTGRYREIYNKWFGALEPRGLPWKTVITYIVVILAIFLLVGSGLILWNVSLRKQVTLRTQHLTSEIEERKRAEEALRISETSMKRKLDAVLSPEGDDRLEDLKLEDILDNQVFQSIMDDFFDLTNITNAILDIHGKILVAAGWQDICTKFHRVHPETSKHCLESDTVLAEGVEPGAFKLYRCKNNMWDIVTPITISGKHIGNIFLGQFIFEDEVLNQENFRAQARRYGFNEKEYLAALARVPRCSHEKIDKAMTFCTKIAHMISTLSYGNIRLARTLTERDRLFHSLRESDELFKVITSNTPDHLLVQDSDLRYSFVMNPQLDLAEQDMIGKTDHDFLSKENADELADIKKRVLKTGSPIRLEVPLSAPNGEQQYFDGSYVPKFDDNGHVDGLIGYFRNVTERKQAEEALSNSEKKYRNIFENATEGIFQSTPEGRYISVNPAFARIGGYDSPSEMINTVTDIQKEMYVHQEDRARLVELLKKQGTITGFEAEIRRRDNAIIWISMNVRAVRDQEGKTTLLEGTIEDITERKRAEEEIRKLNAELEERVAARTAELAEKARQMESFTYSVSHDLKAPLRGIDGYSRLLLEDYSDRLDEEGRTFLTTIRQATEQMRQLIEDLLAYSRMERRSLASHEVHPLDLMQALLAERTDEIEARNVSITVDMPDAVVRADSEGLVQVLRNLLDNALKFTGKTPDPHIEIGGQEKGKACIFWVRDNGIGFDMRYHDRIFEIFQRLHPAEDYPGTGIGMAIVQKAMQRMGGRVWAESDPGEGATFYLEVPK